MALRDHLLQEQESPQAADQFDRDFIRALLAREPDGLLEINDAIERILHGRYGLCEACGRPISRARLRAAPWVRYRPECAPACGRAGLAQSRDTRSIENQTR